jgi:outer membrane autotransporter protein
LAANVEYGIHVRQTKTSDFTPYASLAWTKSERGSITENGTGAGLTLDSDSNSIETTLLGVRYNHRTYDKSGSLKGGIQAGVAWVHQFGDTDFPTSAHFTGAPGSFDIYNTPLSSDAAQVQLGAYGRIHNNVIGFLNYQGTFGGNVHVNSVTGGLGYQF